MNIKTLIYFADADGKLFAGSLTGQSSRRLTDHDFEFDMHMKQSANGRWISYGGRRKGGQSVQYWLFDRQANADRLIYEHPAHGILPSFSPDSNHLVLRGAYAPRWDNDPDAGLFLVDTATLKRTEIKPPATIPAKELMTLPIWSKDGSELLILARSALHNGYEVPFEVYSYRLSSKSFERLIRRDESDGRLHALARDGREIPVSEDQDPRSSRNGPDSESSPDGIWRAFVESKNVKESEYVLKLENRKGRSKLIATMGATTCARQLIAGWLDNDHLLLRHGFLDEFLVYEASSGKMAELPQELKASKMFTW